MAGQGGFLLQSRAQPSTNAARILGCSPARRRRFVHSCGNSWMARRACTPGLHNTCGRSRDCLQHDLALMAGFGNLTQTAIRDKRYVRISVTRRAWAMPRIVRGAHGLDARNRIGTDGTHPSVASRRITRTAKGIRTQQFPGEVLLSTTALENGTPTIPKERCLSRDNLPTLLAPPNVRFSLPMEEPHL